VVSARGKHGEEGRKESAQIVGPPSQTAQRPEGQQKRSWGEGGKGMKKGGKKERGKVKIVFSRPFIKNSDDKEGK